MLAAQSDGSASSPRAACRPNLGQHGPNVGVEGAELDRGRALQHLAAIPRPKRLDRLPHPPRKPAQPSPSRPPSASALRHTARRMRRRRRRRRVPTR